MKRISIFLISVIVIVGMVGCDPTPSPTPQYDLTIASTEGGNVTAPGEGTFTYDEGTVVNLTAEAEACYRFCNWTGDVGTMTDVNYASTTITMSGDYSITAHFEGLLEYQLTISSTTGGSVTTPGEGIFNYYEGTVVNLVAEEEEGYHFVNWGGDMDTIGDVENSTTTVTISGDYSIIANFGEGEVVTFPDTGLEAAIREAIGKPTGDIYQSDLVTLTYLDASDRGIVDLTGLEYCISLAQLDLDHNQISDISPLSGLTSLTWLYLGDNQISSISPLSGLTNLIVLHLDENEISDISPLSGLTSLTWLYLGDNQISDISPLSGLTSLAGLILEDNQISDISPVAGLTSLAGLLLNYNEISDISPLSGLTGLTQLFLHHNEISNISALATVTNLEILELEANQISDISPLSGLTNLTSLGLWENPISDISPLAGLTDLTNLWLGDNEISDISPLSGLINLTSLGLRENQISDISPLSGLTNLTSLGLWENQISDISPLVDNLGLDDGDEVNLEDNPLSSDSINIYIPQLEARGVTVYY